jgi:hypothetical protein
MAEHPQLLWVDKESVESDLGRIAPSTDIRFRA